MRKTTFNSVVGNFILLLVVVISRLPEHITMRKFVQSFGICCDNLVVPKKIIKIKEPENVIDLLLLLIVCSAKPHKECFNYAQSSKGLPLRKDVNA